MSEKPEALRLAEELEALNGAKRDYGGIGGQMLGCEQYRLVASGSSFAALPNSADALLRQHAEIERLTADNERLRGQRAGCGYPNCLDGGGRCHAMFKGECSGPKEVRP